MKVLVIRWELRRWGQVLPMAAAGSPPPHPISLCYSPER